MDKRSPQFVIQEHRTAGGVHWDLMLQTGKALRTWRMDRHPADIGSDPVPLVKLSDHPPRFLTYEGPVQNQTGHVTLVDRGVFELPAQKPDSLTVILDGIVLKGRFSLTKTDDAGRWMLSRQ